MSALKVAIDDQVARITINRPAQNNPVSLAMWRELGTIFAALGEDRECRAVILAGEGASFSAGADVTEFSEVRSGREQVIAYQRAVDDCIDQITDIAKPTIAMVRGYCLGGGCGLAMACDFRLADETAQFAIPAAKLSIVYGTRETQNLLALVGLANAKRILFMGERFDVVRAHEIGLVDEIADDVADLAGQWARTMAALAPLSIAGAKTLLNTMAKDPCGFDPEAANEIVHRASLSEDYAEGRAAYAEKRAPKFKGA